MFLHLSLSHSVHRGASTSRRGRWADPPLPRILRNTVNEPVVRILLECILVFAIVKNREVSLPLKIKGIKSRASNGLTDLHP